MANHEIGQLQLLCLFCQRRVVGSGGMLGDPVWRVYCPHCDITTVFPLERYTTPASVVQTWALCHAQGNLFGQAAG